MNIVIVAAHFDDEVLGMGGTIQKLHEEGNSVYVCVLTDSVSTQYPNNINEMMVKRKAESTEVNKLLGIEYTRCLNFPDMKLDTIPHHLINEGIASFCLDVQADVLFTHNPNDINNDHRIAFLCSMVVARPTATNKINTIYTYEVPSATDWGTDVFRPNFFHCLNMRHVELKIKALGIYESELRPFPHPRSSEHIFNMSRIRGANVGFEYAEGFDMIRRKC